MFNNKVNSMMDVEGRAYHLLKTASRAGETVAVMTTEMFNELSVMNDRFFEGKVEIELFENSDAYFDFDGAAALSFEHSA